MEQNKQRGIEDEMVDLNSYRCGKVSMVRDFYYLQDICKLSDHDIQPHPSHRIGHRSFLCRDRDSLVDHPSELTTKQ